MRKDFKVLDCTLRDGGYYTSWDFQDGFVSKYLKTMREIGVDAVEVGYRSPTKSGYYGRYFYTSHDDLQRLRAGLAPEQQLALMLNAKDLSRGDLTRLLKQDAEIIDLVRFACPPNELATCLIYAEEAAALGIDVALNVMYLSQWFADAGTLEPLADAHNIVSTVSLVDSYGSCFPEDVTIAVAQACRLLPQTIGFHGHDNVQLAFANALAAVKAGAEILDSTVMGMGRGAGNLSTELIYAYKQSLNPNAEAQFGSLAELLDEMSALKAEYSWGSNLAYQIAGFAGLKQAQVMEWLAKRRYRASSIIDALRNQDGMQVDQRSYQDVAELKGALPDSDTAVLIGGGPSVAEHRDALTRLFQANQLIGVHAGLKHAEVFRSFTDHVFCLSGDEAAGTRASIISELEIGAWVVPAPPRFPSSVPDDGRVCQVSVNGASAETKLGPVSDVAPMQMALAVADALGCTRILLCGFDGYAEPSPAELDLMRDVQTSINRFQQDHPDVEVLSLTPNAYGITAASVYSLIQV